MKNRTPDPEHKHEVSDSEQFLFGGRLRYDYTFDDHEQTRLKVGFLTIARQIPGMLRTAMRLAWQAGVCSYRSRPSTPGSPNTPLRAGGWRSPSDPYALGRSPEVGLLTAVAAATSFRWKTTHSHRKEAALGCTPAPICAASPTTRSGFPVVSRTAAEHAVLSARPWHPPVSRHHLPGTPPLRAGLRPLLPRGAPEHRKLPDIGDH